MMREIIFDTETTGLDPATGDRVVEIGCIEVIGRIPTGRTFHTYCNPERPMPAEAARVHGLVDAFLADKPLFSAIADDFLAFVGDSPLVAHNAAFDMKFINAELARCGRALLPAERAVDTVLLCRKRFPGGSVSLDVMCQRFGIDRSRRVFHGALLDAELLAEVYIELHGGRQIGLSLAHPDTQDGASRQTGPAVRGAIVRPPRIFSVPPAEQEAHDAFIAGIANALWHSDRASAAARRR